MQNFSKYLPAISLYPLTEYFFPTNITFCLPPMWSLKLPDVWPVWVQLHHHFPSVYRLVYNFLPKYKRWNYVKLCTVFTVCFMLRHRDSLKFFVYKLVVTGSFRVPRLILIAWVIISISVYRSVLFETSCHWLLRVFCTSRFNYCAQLLHTILRFTRYTREFILSYQPAAFIAVSGA